MNVNELLKYIDEGKLDNALSCLYCEEQLPYQKARYAEAVNEFASLYGSDREVSIFSVPGRSEISGNHTDHQRGCVIAAAIDLDIIAVAESTPGPIAINAATFIGYRTGGFIGALAATLGVVLPSLCIILAIATVLNNFHNIAVVQHAFWGIRIGVLALVIKAFLTVQKQCPKNLFSYCIAVAAFIAVVFLNINVFAVIICSAAAGFILSLIMAKGDRK